MKGQIEYRYSRIEVEQFAIIKDNVSDPDGDIQYSTECQFMYDKEHFVLVSKILVNMSQGEDLLLKAEVDSSFQINPSSIETLTKDDSIVFPADALVQFASLCYGTLRGIIHIKTTGTQLNQYILPPVYLHETIKQSFVVKE